MKAQRILTGTRGVSDPEGGGERAEVTVAVVGPCWHAHSSWISPSLPASLATQGWVTESMQWWAGKRRPLPTAPSGV